ncbi:ly6/PLAUR domain-containing protein 3 [Pelobates fuscus]|uniref:ly6/PLAUR domain-containing protein 3 n=1 Tax=Pelobates fuscus TaxID=191477 RepID=UPI002FE4ABC4
MGNGNCSDENVAKVLCRPDQNVCIETVTALETSHDQSTMLQKGCGTGLPGRVDKAEYFHGVIMYIMLIQCNTSLCNTELHAKTYLLLPPENTGRQLNEMECYSCIGKTPDQCTSSNAPVKQCFQPLRHCFDGNVTVTQGNTSAVIPIKSCSERHTCAMRTLKFGSSTFEIKGACCIGNICNKDLSNMTQYVELPPLVLIPPSNEPPTTPAIPTWGRPTKEQPHANGTTQTLKEANITVGSDTTSLKAAIKHEDDQQPSKASQSQISLWLVFLNLVLFKF